MSFTIAIQFTNVIQLQMSFTIVIQFTNVIQLQMSFKPKSSYKPRPIIYYKSEPEAKRTSRGKKKKKRLGK